MNSNPAVENEQLFRYDDTVKPKDEEKYKANAQATFALAAQTGLSGLTLTAIACEPNWPPEPSASTSNPEKH